MDQAQILAEVEDLARTMPPRDDLSDGEGAACYQSGASFKDGAKNARVTITQITDALVPMLNTYENIWSKAAIRT